MINIAAHVHDLSPSQKSFYLIKEFNKCIDNTDISPSVFHNRNCIPPKNPFFATKMSLFMSSFKGVLIGTTLEEVRTILKLPAKSDRYFYLWDLDWLKNPVHFESAMKILRSDHIKIITRSKTHADVVEAFCNKKTIGIVDNWNMEQLLYTIGL
jgi:hypothetical protein